MLQSVCVFCGSSHGDRPAYREAAGDLGRLLAERDIELVYGGGGIGLMGVIADASLEAGGTVTGVVPGFLAEREVAHRGLSQLHVVDSMHERKALMERLSGGFVVLPGGWGTLDELFEILTWGQLGLHSKPVGLLDVDGYFGPLVQLIDHTVREGFVGANQRGRLLHSALAGELLERMAGWNPPAPVI